MCTRPSVWILMLSVVATIWHNQNACGFMYLKCFKCQTLGAFAIRHSTENECSCPNLNYQGYGKKNVSYETCQTLDPGGNAQLTNQTKPSPLVHCISWSHRVTLWKSDLPCYTVREYIQFYFPTAKSSGTRTNTTSWDSSHKHSHTCTCWVLKKTAPVGTSENGSRAPWGHY